MCVESQIASVRPSFAAQANRRMFAVIALSLSLYTVLLLKRREFVLKSNMIPKELANNNLCVCLFCYTCGDVSFESPYTVHIVFYIK